jgi:hypothetical protein
LSFFTHGAAVDGGEVDRDADPSDARQLIGRGAMTLVVVGPARPVWELRDALAADAGG